MIPALTWSGLPRNIGGGFGACVEWPTNIALPDIAGQTLTIDGKDYPVKRVQRLFRDTRQRKPASRIVFVTSDEGGEKSPGG